MIEQGLDVLACLSSDKGDRNMPHGLERIAQVSHPAFGWHVFFHGVPFIDDEHACLVVVIDVVAELFVDLADTLRSIEKH